MEVELAEKLVEIIPSAEMCRFFKNGSDATEIAVRLARAYTGKTQILCGSYHGFHDWYIASTKPALGIPYQGQIDETYVRGFKNYDELSLSLS